MFRAKLGPHGNFLLLTLQFERMKDGRAAGHPDVGFAHEPCRGFP